MSQRITLAAVCLMACVGLAGLLMAFQMMQNNQALNQQMLAQMTSLLAKSQSDSGKPTDSLNWTEFKVKVVRESAEGPAVKGATVSLQGVLYGSEGSISLTETTNSEGLVNFGPIQVGRSTVSVALPSGFLSSNTIYVRPSQEMTEVIVAPVPPKPAEVQVLVEWPTSIKSDDVWMICDFAQIPREVEEFSWLEPYRPTALAGMSFPGGKSIAISRDGQMYEIKQKQKQFDGVKGSVLLLRDFDESTKSPGMLLKRDQLKTNDGEFELLRCGVFVKVPSKMKALPPNMELKLAYIVSYKDRYSTFGGGGMTGGGFGFGGLSGGGTGGGFFMVKDVPGTTVNAVQELLEPPIFQAIAGQQNTWTIKLPQQMIDDFKAATEE